MQGYTKLFQSIITSTIWQESNDAKALWVSMLALKDGDHICRATVPALAKLNNMTLEQTNEILQKFQEPDPYSRSQEHEGRRIERCDQGWIILNGAKYQKRMDQDERREYKRIKAQEYRKRSRGHSVDKRGQTLNDVDKVSKMDTQDTASASASATKKNKNTLKNERAFDTFWSAYPRKVGKQAARKAWKKAKLDTRTNDILEALESQKAAEQWKRDNGRYIPYPSTWLNEGRWEDEPDNAGKEVSWKEKFMEGQR